MFVVLRTKIMGFDVFLLFKREYKFLRYQGWVFSTHFEIVLRTAKP